MSTFTEPRRAGNAIGLDVGGTKIAGGIVAADGSILEKIRPVHCPAEDSEATFGLLHQIIEDLHARHPQVEAIGIGAAGLVLWPEGRIRWAPNNGYRDLPLRQLVHQATGLPTVVDNDANTAAWAEARLGTAAADMAFLTVGTGLGGGLVVEGRIFRGHTGIGAEIGHLIVDPHGSVLCNCGNVGCLEALASGTALRRLGRAAAVTDPDGALAALAGQGPVTGEHVLQAALAGDPKAQAIFAEVGDWLGIGIASLITLFDFELVVVGGGVGGAGDLILRPARASFERFVFARAHRELPEIVHATLGPDAGWIGAAILALDEYAEVSATSVDQTLRQPTDTSAVDKKGDYGQADHPIPGPDLPPRTQHAVSTR